MLPCSRRAHRSVVASILGIVAVLVCARVAAGEPFASAAERQVNSYVTNQQKQPSLASAPDGRFVVVWASQGSSGTDTSGYSVQGQRYDAAGRPAGGEFQVNTYTTSNQVHPQVASDAQGAFVVVWESYASAGPDTDRTIHGQRYDGDGNELGSEFQVNSYTTGAQRRPSVAVDPLGGFLVGWESNGSAGNDASSYSIQVRLFDDAGAPQGDDVQVNTFTANAQQAAAVAVDGQGGFLVAWDSLGSSGGDSDSFSIQAQRYDGAGATVGGNFQVNSATTGAQDYPAVAADGAGNFVVAWQSFGSTGGDSSGYSVQARRFDSSGVAQGADFQVNTYTFSFQDNPRVTSDADGNFIVAWQSFGSSGTDSSDNSIQMQRYASDGTPIEGELQVDADTSGSQAHPAIAADGRGSFEVAWTSATSQGSDQSFYSIQVRRYDGLFRDGFESGGTGAWSFHVP